VKIRKSENGHQMKKLKALSFLQLVDLSSTVPLPWAKIFELKKYKSKSKTMQKGGPLDDFEFLVALPPSWSCPPQRREVPSQSKS
jgi:hypothetical protein